MHVIFAVPERCEKGAIPRKQNLEEKIIENVSIVYLIIN